MNLQTLFKLESSVAGVTCVTLVGVGVVRRLRDVHLDAGFVFRVEVFEQLDAEVERLAALGADEHVLDFRLSSVFVISVPLQVFSGSEDEITF